MPLGTGAMPMQRFILPLRRLPSLIVLGAVVLFVVIGPGGAQTSTPVYTWTTLAGRASNGSEDGPGEQARFNGPVGLAADASGNVYVADRDNHTIRKITPMGIVSTLAGSPGIWGSADGAGPAARFDSPEGVGVDAAGNVYVADTGNHTIRRVTPDGVVTTIAGQAGKEGTVDGAATEARFSSPRAIAADRSGTVYVADHGIRRITGGTVQTMYSGGPVPGSTSGLTVALPTSFALAVDGSGRVVFTANIGTGVRTGYVVGNGVCAIDSSGTLSVLFRNGYNAAEGRTPEEVFYWADIASFGSLAVEGSGNILVCTFGAFGFEPCWVGKISPEGKVLDTYAVRGESGLAARGTGVTVDPGGNVFFTRSPYGVSGPGQDGVIVRVNLEGKETVFAGTPRHTSGIDGKGDAARFAALGQIHADADGNVWASDVWGGQGDTTSGVDHGVGLRKVAATGTTTTPMTPKIHGDMQFRSFGVSGDDAGNIYLGSAEHDGLYLSKVGPTGTVTAETYSGIVGYGPGSFVADAKGNLIVTDGAKHVLRQRSPEGVWSILAGVEDEAGTTDGTGGKARFNAPAVITKDRSGYYYVLDYSLSSGRDSTLGYDVCFIRRITPAGDVTTESGNLAQNFLTPASLAVSSSGTFFLTYGNSLWLLDNQGKLTLIGGSLALEGAVDGTGSAARFAAPGALVVNAQDTLYAVDGYGTTIRKGQYLGRPPAITTQPQSQSVMVGQSARFSIGVTGEPAPTYQWSFEGRAIAGATASSYTVASAQLASAGDYTVEVANPLGKVTSSKATLSVAAAQPAPPVKSGGGGGGGACSLWFALALPSLVLVRRLTTGRAPRPSL